MVAKVFRVEDRFGNKSTTMDEARIYGVAG